MSLDNAAQATERQKSIQVDRRCNRAWSRVCDMRVPGCIVSIVCCHTGEHKAAKARLSGQHPPANRWYLIPGVTWNGVALLIVGSLYVRCSRPDS